jgi:hypothetical protein
MFVLHGHKKEAFVKQAFLQPYLKIMTTFQTLIKKALSELRDRLAQALAALPLGDQLVVEGPVKSLITDQTWAMNRIAEAMALIDDESTMTEATAEVIAAAVAGGEIFRKDSFGDLFAKEVEEKGFVSLEKLTADIAAAVEAQKAESTQEVTNLGLIASRRATAVTEHGKALMAMSDDDFLSEDHEARVGLFAGRLASLTGLGLDLEKHAETVTIFCSHPLTEEGQKVFENMLKVSVLAGKAPEADPKDPLKPGVTRPIMAGSLGGDDNAPKDKPKRKLFI